MLRFHQATCELLGMVPIVDEAARAAISDRERRLGVKIPAAVGSGTRCAGQSRSWRVPPMTRSWGWKSWGSRLTAGAVDGGTLSAKVCWSFASRTRVCVIGQFGWTMARIRGCWSRSMARRIDLDQHPRILAIVQVGRAHV